MARNIAFTAVLIASSASLVAAASDPATVQGSQVGHYATAVRSSVVSTLASVPWPGHGACSVELIQVPGGQVVRATLVNCAFPADIQATVLKKLQSATLPYQGFESVFQRRIVINLQQARPPG